MANKNRVKKKRAEKRKLAKLLKAAEKINSSNDLIKEEAQLSETAFAFCKSAKNDLVQPPKAKTKNNNNFNSINNASLMGISTAGLIVPDNSTVEHFVDGDQVPFRPKDVSNSEIIEQIEEGEDFSGVDVPENSLTNSTPNSNNDIGLDEAPRAAPATESSTTQGEMTPQVIEGQLVDDTAPDPSGKEARTKPTGIFKVPVYGVIVSNDYDMPPFNGEIVTPESIIDAINWANSSPFVERIVMDYNSPGGDLYLGQEVVETIVNSKKPILAYISQYACSQAYLYASAAQTIVAGKDAIVGSLGIMTSYMTPEQLEGSSISANASKKNSQESSIKIGNELEELYHSTIARGRKTTLSDVRRNYGEGEEVIASRALSVGMIDEIKSRNQFYLDLAKDIDFKYNGESMLDEANVGDVSIDTNSNFEIYSTEIVSNEEASAASMPTTKENKEEDIPKALKAEAVVGKASASLNTFDKDVFLKEFYHLYNKDLSNDPKSSAKTQNNQNKIKSNETIANKTAQNVNVNTSPLVREDKSKDIKMSNDKNSPTTDGESNIEHTNLNTSEQANLHEQVARTAATATAETMKKLQETDDSEILKISKDDLMAMLELTATKTEENIISTLNAEKKAEEEARKAKLQRRDAILKATADSVDSSIAEMMADNEDLADKPAEVIIGLLSSMKTQSPKNTHKNTHKEPSENQVNPELMNDVGLDTVATNTSNTSIAEQVVNQAQQAQQAAAQEQAPTTEEAPSELSLMEARLKEMEKLLFNKQEEEKQRQDVFNQEIEHDSSVTSPMIAAMEQQQNQPAAAYSAGTDPLSGARMTYIDQTNGATAQAAPVFDEDKEFAALLKGFNKDIDDAKASALIASENKCSEIFGSMNSAPVRVETLQRMGVDSHPYKKGI